MTIWRMPDWTYHPLRPLASAVLGVRRSQRAALHGLATLVSLPGGAEAVSAVFDHPAVPADLAGRFGASVPVSVARDAIRALAVQGASVIEIGPVEAADLPAVRAALAGRRCEVIGRAATAEVAEQLAPLVDRVIVGDPPDVVRLTEPSIDGALAALADESATVLATPAVLVEAGPGWFQRVIEARQPTEPAPRVRDAGLDPRRWPAWVWGLIVGLAMTGGGLVAAGITLGPVLLWYDQDFLGMNLSDVDAVNARLAHFLQHDRITMAGGMVAIGILYTGLAWGGIRRGWPWARVAYLVSGLIGFPTLLYFLGTGFVEPLHTALAVVLFPMFLLATWRRPAVARWTIAPEGPEPERRRALAGQLLLIVTGVGLFAGGATVSIVGLTGVFVDTDLVFLGTDPAFLDAANPHLAPFIAHDRAGFGGLLMATAAAIVLLSLWGWRRGEAWVWWTLAGAATAGFAPALIIHKGIGYTSFEHLFPVYLGVVFSVIALALSNAYLRAGR
ncbi:hypothetical protein AB0M47_35910 [Hamadaea sp. NPDC051192]|uniref:hypothetical protein n=1 Tax=Hamadaea sp. NPDC051192 TaxID=3154940 RepID=UPI003421EAD3